jgi:hypothetical protein
MLTQSNSQTPTLSTPSILDNRPSTLNTPPTLPITASNSFTVATPPTFRAGGRTIDNASSLGVLEGTRSIQDVLGVSSVDRNSYYRFSLNAQSNISMVLTGLTGDADLRLLDASGNIVGSSLLFGYTQDESISLANVAAGEYFIRVNQFSGDTRFNLNLSSTRTGLFTDNLNNLLANEFELNNVWGSLTQTGTINNANTSDTYHFDNPFISSNYSLSLTGLSSDVDIRVVRDANRNGIVDLGDTISYSARTGAANETIELQGLGTGEYFIQIHQGSPSSNSNYSLTIQNQPGTALTTEPNDTIAQSYNLGVLNGSRHFNGAFTGRTSSSGTTGNTEDFYRFSLGTTSDFSLSVTGMTSNANVEVIRDSNRNGIVDFGEVVALSTSPGINSEAILMQGLGTGEYIVRVYQDTNNTLTDTNYSLSLQATPGLGLPGLPGSTSEIKTLNGVREFGGTINNRRQEDLYFFDLTTRSDFKLDLTGLTENLNVRVYADANRNGRFDIGEALVGSSLQSGSQSESINLQGLQAGRYLVWVNQGTSFLDSSNYVLKLEANPTSSTFVNDDNSRFRAVNFGSLTNSSLNSRSVSDFVGTSDTQDFYSFTVGTTGTLAVNLSRLGADANIQLQSSDGTVLGESLNTGTSSEFITRGLAAGQYFIRVYQGTTTSNTNYNLDWDFQTTFR